MLKFKGVLLVEALSALLIVIQIICINLSFFMILNIKKAQLMNEIIHQETLFRKEILSFRETK